jgi:hypothetical protein
MIRIMLDGHLSVDSAHLETIPVNEFMSPPETEEEKLGPPIMCSSTSLLIQCVAQLMVTGPRIKGSWKWRKTKNCKGSVGSELF